MRIKNRPPLPQKFKLMPIQSPVHLMSNSMMTKRSSLMNLKNLLPQLLRFKLMLIQIQSPVHLMSSLMRIKNPLPLPQRLNLMMPKRSRLMRIKNPLPLPQRFKLMLIQSPVHLMSKKLDLMMSKKLNSMKKPQQTSLMKISTWMITKMLSSKMAQLKSQMLMTKMNSLIWRSLHQQKLPELRARKITDQHCSTDRHE